MMQNTIKGSQRYVWDTSKSLGQGATSKVYKGRTKTTGVEIAVKVFTPTAQLRPLEVQLREYQVMRKLDHKNIVRLLDIEEENGSRNRVIVMELSTCGSLYNMLDDPQNAFGLREEQFILVLEHVACGMKYLHENGIVHRDVKPGNILCYKQEDGRLVFKLTDFGAARELEDEDQQFMSLYGTEEYLHPDVYGRAVMRAHDIGPFNASVDLWSLGVTIFHAATGQLPFRPYGGRRNRKTMYEITKNKAPGYISAVQSSENGRIEWSKNLPETCRLSNCLKTFLTRILAGLLENNDRYKITFKKFFDEVENFISRSIIHVFSPDLWMLMKIYIDRHSKLSRLQDVIAEQSEIASPDQILLLNGDLLSTMVDSMTAVCNYPKSVFCEETPIFLFSKLQNEQRNFPVVVSPDFPRFSATNNVSSDYQMSKQCSGVLFALSREIREYHLKNDLIRKSVRNYLQELNHECTHLIDYQRHLVRHCDTSRAWLNHYRITIKHNLTLLKMLVGQHHPHFLNLKKRIKSVEDLNDREGEVKSLSQGVDRLLEEYQQKCREKQKNGAWFNYSEGCKDEKDRCVERMEVVVDTVQRISRHFKEHRQTQYLNRNEEDVHSFEKNQLQELCSTSQSLIDRCDKNAKRLFRFYQMFSSQATEARMTNDDIENELEVLAQKQEEFVKELGIVSGEINDSLTALTQTTKVDKIDKLGFPKGFEESLESEKQEVLRQINQSLSVNSEGLNDLKKTMEKNNQLWGEHSSLLKEMNSMIISGKFDWDAFEKG